MKDYQQRVVDEKQALDIKLVALIKYLENTEKVTALPPEEHERLIRQAGIMQNYSNILYERVTAFS